MAKYLVLVAVSLAMCGCASRLPTSQICFGDKAQSLSYNSIDQKAIDAVKSKIRHGCGQRGIECNLDLRHVANGKIEITASRALVSGNPPKCTRLEGGFETYVFTSQGKYLRVILGI